MLPLTACDIEVLVGFDVSSTNIFNAQPNLLKKMGSILQRVSKMGEISCSSGQLPSVQVAIMAMDSASEPVSLDFTDNAETLHALFQNLRTNGPFFLNGKTISMYTNRFRGRQGATKVVTVPCLTALDCLFFFKYSCMHTRVSILWMKYNYQWIKILVSKYSLIFE